MKILRKLFLLILILAVAAGGFLFWLYRDLHTPRARTAESPQSDESSQTVEIPRGATSDQMFDRLESSGVIGRAWELKLYTRIFPPKRSLKAGTYRFAAPISPLAALRKLEEGEQSLARFTIIEGWTRFDIAGAMARLPELKLESPAQALELMNDTSLITDLDPDAKNLEGYLYPDTYSFAPGATPQEMIAAMVRRFRQVWRSEFSDRAFAAGKSPHEVVTVASLIETEAKLSEERPVIASVIYNRLQKNMPLGIDSTVVYASKLAGAWKNNGHVYQSDLERDSPYNTRKHAGLPPGPVGSPAARSIEAALNPAQTNYLYYVREPSRDDGAHNFYNNPTDFERGVQALRAWEAQQKK